MDKTASTNLNEKKDDGHLALGVGHIAFIMDGNGRWATARNLPRHKGHQEGFKRVREIAKACRDLSIGTMSLYAFSTENWKRPQEEIDFLFKYLDYFLKKEIPNLIQDDCRLHVSGDISRLPEHSIKALQKGLSATAHCQTFTLNICLNYGGQQEILQAAKSLAAAVLQGQMALESIDAAAFESKLYTASLPPVDLLIRTSGEVRLSNFMLYQLAYAEMIFTPTRWPDFKKSELLKCLEEYQTRNRRFGGL
jgi:undecaprenyl diphosphate synthase